MTVGVKGSQPFVRSIYRFELDSRLIRRRIYAAANAIFGKRQSQIRISRAHKDDRRSCLRNRHAGVAHQVNTIRPARQGQRVGRIQSSCRTTHRSLNLGRTDMAKGKNSKKEAKKPKTREAESSATANSNAGKPAAFRFLVRRVK